MIMLQKVARDLEPFVILPNIFIINIIWNTLYTAKMEMVLKCMVLPSHRIRHCPLN